MIHKAMIFVGLCSLFLYLSACRTARIPTDSSGTEAVSVSDFLNSMGAVSSVSRRGETVEGTINCLKYTGLRWLRSGYEDDAPLEDFLRVHQATDAMFCYGLLSGHSDIERLLDDARQLANAGALLAIEGSNEPNNWGIIYNRQHGGANRSWLPVAQLHRDLYAAVKNDPKLKNCPVFATTETGAQTDNCGLQFLTIPSGADSLLMPPETKYADYANCHNYICHPSWPGLHDNQTWLSATTDKSCPVDGLYGNYGHTWRNKFNGYSEEELARLPRVTTETGIPLSPETPEITEEIQARMYLNLYLSQFKRGWKYTAVYLLKGRSNEPAHESFAFYTLDYRPRQAAHYLHNMTTILADNLSITSCGRLSYSIPDQPETVHDLLLQRSDGAFMLVLWGERFASHTTDRVRIDLAKSRPQVTVYDPTIGTEPQQQLSNIQYIDIELLDHPLILKIF
ncbi:MAG: glycosyl hydrolase [Dysgonamonadaceae bacterium]|jgi:hypothetical protein|nr:glycosyl hydrolase [Dysgonamonadaceae bacterium]